MASVRHLGSLAAVALTTAFFLAAAAAAADQCKTMDGDFSREHLAGCIATCKTSSARGVCAPLKEAYVREPMPPGFQVINSDMDGNVFADAMGRTLYKWPLLNLRNGDSGEAPGTIQCFDVPSYETAGFTSPYPGGRLLPQADRRPTCTQHWPPVLAAADAKPAGNWSLLERPDGTKQWAYNRQALYTSHLDHRPGQTNGGTTRVLWDFRASGATRHPVGPAPAVPAQFKAASMALGRMLVTHTGFAVYAYDKDTPTKSNCSAECLKEWSPMMAPDAAVARGEWTMIARPNGRQWVFRGMPLYTHIADANVQSYTGSDLPGWSNVFLQYSPRPPAGFQVADTWGGQVLADKNGHTLYFYSCGEDTVDSLFCSSPDSPQEYRWAVCGGGDPARCLETFPYVIADENATSDNLIWGVITINPMTGRFATPDSAGSLRVWAYRGNPVYTFAGDKNPGDLGADSWGQDHGVRNGYKALWLRDDFKNNDS